MSGKEHNRRTAALVLGFQPAAADKLLRALEAKFPGVYSQKRGRELWFRFDRFRLPQAPTTSEAVAACLAAGVAKLFANSDFELAMRRALERITSAAHPNPKIRYTDLDRKFFFVSRGGDIGLKSHGGRLDEVIGAILGEHALALEYKTFEGKREALTVRPLSLAIHEHQLYVIARQPNDELRALRFARISKANGIEHERFEYPSVSSYDPEVVFRNTFGVFVRDTYKVAVVEIDLTARWRTYAKYHRWHVSQSSADTKTGVRVQLEAKVCPELEAWVLSFGEDARVVRPKELRDKIRTRLARAAEAYEATRN